MPGWCAACSPRSPRLGDGKVARLPRIRWATGQVAKEDADAVGPAAAAARDHLRLLGNGREGLDRPGV